MARFLRADKPHKFLLQIPPPWLFVLPYSRPSPYLLSSTPFLAYALPSPYIYGLPKTCRLFLVGIAAILGSFGFPTDHRMRSIFPPCHMDQIDRPSQHFLTPLSFSIMSWFSSLPYPFPCPSGAYKAPIQVAFNTTPLSLMSQDENAPPVSLR